MNKTTTAEWLPKPNVIVTSNNNPKKIYDGKNIYLSDGEYFEFKIINPTSDKISVNISLNGNSSIDNLVLQPGESTIIDRFIDTNKKMCFKTYNYDENNSEVVKNNGKVVFNFFKKIKNHNGYQPCIPWTHPHTPYIQPTTQPCCYPTTDQPYPQIIYTSNLSDNSVSYNSNETGIIDQGVESKQHFNVDYDTFEYNSFHTIEYNLLPYSKMKNKVRNYCVDCGYRIRKNSWKYCPKCGEKV